MIQTSLSLSRSEDTSEVSDVVTLWLRSEDTTEEEVEIPGAAGKICGTFVCPNSVLEKLAPADEWTAVFAG